MCPPELSKESRTPTKTIETVSWSMTFRERSPPVSMLSHFLFYYPAQCVGRSTLVIIAIYPIP